MNFSKSILLLFLLIAGVVQSQNLEWGISTPLPKDVTTDAAGNVYVVGDYTGTVDLDPGVDTLSFTAFNNEWTGYIQKLDAAGNLIWGKSFEVLNNTYGMVTTLIEVDMAGNVFVVGTFRDNIDLDPGIGGSICCSARRNTKHKYFYR